MQSTYPHTERTAWPYPRLFAHRGAGHIAPENTLAAMRVGHQLGYGAVEFDAKLSRDAVALLMHDDTLERTTNGHGAFRDFDASALLHLDAGAWHSQGFAGEPIPTLPDVLRYLGDNGMVADVEIKPCPGRGTETGEVVARELAAYLQASPHAASQFFVSSFSVDALRAAQSVAPQVPRTLLAERYDPSCDALLQSLGCRTFATDHAALTPNLVAHMHASGYWVMAYTINVVARAREVLGWGVDAIFTDALTDMAAAFPTRHC